MNTTTALRTILPVVPLVASALITFAGAACAQKSAEPAPTASVQDSPALARFKAAGKAAPMTVYPARLAGRSSEQVGEVVGMMLERAGMTKLDLSTNAFTPPEGADLAASARAFGDFVRAAPPATDYALFTDIIGSPREGLSELRTIVADKDGAVVFQDRQAKGDADFDRLNPREPMECCILAVERLRPVLGLNDPSRSEASGDLAKRWQQKSGIPDKAELAAIQTRAEAFKKAAPGATLVIYPVHAGEDFSPESAATLAAEFTRARLTNASAPAQGPNLPLKGDMNEQKVLWASARAFSDYVKKNPLEANYAMYADYLMGKDSVGAVHFFVCDRAGELVIVDFQNSHHADFKAIKPRTREDCDRLVAKRLAGYLR